MLQSFLFSSPSHSLNNYQEAELERSSKFNEDGGENQVDKTVSLGDTIIYSPTQRSTEEEKSHFLPSYKSLVDIEKNLIQPKITSEIFKPQFQTRRKSKPEESLTKQPLKPDFGFPSQGSFLDVKLNKGSTLSAMSPYFQQGAFKVLQFEILT